MHRKTTYVSLLFMGLVLILSFLGAVQISTAGTDPEVSLVEKDYYFIAGYNTVPTSWPGPTPSPSHPGFTWTFTANQPHNPVHSPYGYNMSSVHPEGSDNYLFEGCLESIHTPDTWGDPNAYVEVDITNNLGYGITILDLTAEVTAGTFMTKWQFPLGMVWMGNMSIVCVDTLDPWSRWLPDGPYPPTYDECDYNTGTVQVHRDNFDAAHGREYPDWFRMGNGWLTYPYPWSQLGPGSLLLDDPLHDAAATNHVKPVYLANGATLTEYFGIILFGYVPNGTPIDATITLRLKYDPPSLTKIHSLQGVIDLDNPVTTYWHELYPNFSTEYHLTDWVENVQNGVLDTGDQIQLYNAIADEVTWWYVRNVSITLYLTQGPPLPPDPVGPNEEMYIESVLPQYMWPWPYDLVETTLWHEAFPEWCNLYHADGFIDNGDQILSVSDFININGFWYHISGVATDLEIVEKVFEVRVPNAVILFPCHTYDTMYAYTEMAALPMNITVKNWGTLTASSINVDVYVYGNVSHSGWIYVGSQLTSDLPPCNSTILTFYLNLKTYARPYYSQKAEVWYVKVVVDATGPEPFLISHDELVTGVKTNLIGDVDNNHKIDVIDQRKVQLVMFEMHPSQAYLNSNQNLPPPIYTDIDGNGRIDVLDQRLQQLHMFEIDMPKW